LGCPGLITHRVMTPVATRPTGDDIL
jgi:hypothetical protein